MDIPYTHILTAIGTLAATIGLLWRTLESRNKAIEKGNKELEARFLAELANRDSTIQDLVQRIRQLEEDRLSDTRTHAAEYRKLNLQCVVALNSNNDALREVARAMRDIREPQPKTEPISKRDTDALVAKLTTARHP